MGDFITDYIKSIENPDRIGWNGKVWGAPTLKGYDVNQRGYGIDIRYNNAAKNLVKNRKGLWLTDKEVTDLMNLHLLYITGVAKRKIKGFDTFSPKKQAAILGMLYRGDSVQSNVNVNEPNDTKFLNAVHTYYKNKGLNQRMLNSINFFSKYLKGGLIRKMLTAAGGPIRLSPEQIASFEYVPGMNNSGMQKFRKEGVLALQYKILEAKKKEEEIKSRMEMKPVLKKKASVVERFKGEKDKYEQQPQVVGMSGADPVGQFVVETAALGGLGKLGLWGAAKYAPKTWLGNQGRKYFVGDAFNYSFKDNVAPTISQFTSLNYQPIKLLNESGSLKFFERQPSRISLAERLGISKGERNFKPKWHVANYPGYLLKGLMKGSLLEKQLSKNGTININLLNAYFNKASQVEKEVANKVLAEKFSGLKTIDYNLFKKAVLDELITYERVPLTKYAKYGMDRLGFTNKVEGLFEEGPLVLAGIPQNVPLQEPLSGIKTNTFTFESPRLPVGNNKHYDITTLGHSRTFTTPDEPNILHIMESLSDWSQEGIAKTNEAYRQKLINNPESYNKRINSLLRMNEELEDWKNMVKIGVNHASIKLQPYEIQQIQQEFIPNLQKNILNLKSKLERNPQALHLSNNYLQRQLQENLKYAAENGLTKMRYPTSETAAKIEGYVKVYPTNRQISWNEYDLMDYSPEYQTILKKYADFPKLFLKLFKDLKVRTVTDTKGNTWYEVDVPKGYLSREWLFKKGGKMNIIEQFKKGYKIKIKESQKGSFTKYCNGKVTNECIQRGKNSPDPKIRKKATFALNSRRWKHLLGGQLIKAEEGLKLNFWQKAGNALNSDWGKFAINAGQLIYSSINNGIQQTKLNDRLQKWKLSYINSIEPEDFSLQVAEEEKQLKLMYPDYNSSPIVSAYKENTLATQAANKAKQKASQEADWIIMLLLLNLNKLSSSTGGGFGSLLTGGLEMLGLLGSKKSNTGTNTGTTNLSTSLNGSPSTYNVFLNNTYTLPAPTIPIKYKNFKL